MAMVIDTRIFVGSRAQTRAQRNHPIVTCMSTELHSARQPKLQCRDMFAGRPDLAGARPYLG